ncbi:MAG: aldolase/citrate lyase family protein [Alphaproteobacteria bacterium]|nr:aldolase/citrate lyase family protein [Alphaproteobacteria bacterium]
MSDLITKRRSLKKTLLEQDKAVFGAWTSLAHLSIAEIFSRSGVDFVGIDIEHSTFSLEQCRDVIAACQAEGSLCLPRIGSHDMEAIKRLLDSGADGIIAPMVSNVDQAKQLVNWVKYPPFGKRSFGVARAQGYGFDFAEYAANWNDSSSLIVQIEDVEGIENIDQIAAVEGVDGCMAGPYDLSGSLGVPGQINHPKVHEACQKVVAACKKAGKACGTHLVEPDAAGIAKAIEDGFTFIILSSDVFLLWKWAERQKQLIEEARR